jgi:hypothetical protein
MWHNSEWVCRYGLYLNLSEQKLISPNIIWYKLSILNLTEMCWIFSMIELTDWQIDEHSPLSAFTPHIFWKTHTQNFRKIGEFCLLEYNAVEFVESRRCFGGTWRLHLRGRRISRAAENEQSFACHLLSRWFLARFILRPWRWRRHVPPKRRLTFNENKALYPRR